MENNDKPKKRKSIWTKRVLFFVVILICAYGIFLEGYLSGQKNENIGIAPNNIINSQNNKSGNVDFSTFWQAWNDLKAKSVANPGDQTMEQGAISGMLASLNDPYTVYFTKDENSQFSQDMAGQFDGIGVEIVQKNNLATVVAPLSGSPAEKAGLKPNDVIAAVDGVAADKMSFDDLVAKIRGKEGTTVKLTILRDKTTLNISVVRQQITVKSVDWNLKNVDGKKYEVVQIKQFGDDTDTLFAQAAADILKNKPEGVILDLRDNPGGYLQSAVDVASYFIPDSTIVTEKGKEGNQDYTANGNATLKNYKVTLLVNDGTASAAEILSGAMRDRLGSKLVGEKTFGKGCVQELINLSDGSAVKITTANWFTPSGKGITGTGLTPDISVAAPTDTTSTSDPQLDRAVQFLESGK